MIWIVFILYGLLLADQTRRMRFPVFSLYLATFLVKLGMWKWTLAHPPGLGLLPLIEPVLTVLKILVFVEAFRALTEDVNVVERRLLLPFFGCISGIGIVLAGQYVAQPDWYHATRNYVNLALGVSSLLALVCFWIEPVRADREAKGHGIILAAYFVNLAVTGLIPQTRMGGWVNMNTVYLAVSIVCAEAWIVNTQTRWRIPRRKGRRELWLEAQARAENLLKVG